jgi:nucleoside-diphosphate-sugar epimerase
MMVESKKNVLITGSEGIIGKILVQRLVDYNMIRLDRYYIKDKNYIRLDLTNFEVLRKELKNYLPIDCILHLAADSKVNAPWESVLKNNIVATRNVFDFAGENHIEKVIFTSSNHVTGLYEGSPPSLHLQNEIGELIDSNMPIRPDSYYAVSKVFGEAIGRYFSETYNIKVICLRIGTVLKDDNPQINNRFRSTWLSHDDLVELIRLSLESEVKFGIYYGVSNNTRRFWDISNAKKELGYEPKDNAEKWFKEDNTSPKLPSTTSFSHDTSPEICKRTKHNENLHD